MTSRNMSSEREQGDSRKTRHSFRHVQKALLLMILAAVLLRDGQQTLASQLQVGICWAELL